MARDKEKETATADPQTLVNMINYLLPEVNALSPVAALHLSEVNAILQRKLANLKKRRDK
jgi:hypothetical protein